MLNKEVYPILAGYTGTSWRADNRQMTIMLTDIPVTISIGKEEFERSTPNRFKDLIRQRIVEALLDAVKELME